MDLFETLKTLSEANGPSGNIAGVSAAAAELLRPLVDEVETDRFCSVLGIRRCGRENAPRVLLDAHLDEIGFMVTGYDEDFLRFRPVGGVDARMLPGRELTLMTRPERVGIVAVKPPHVLSQEEREHAIPLEELRIDVGLTQEEARSLIPIGATAVYREKCVRLHGSRVTGKAMDDRSCFVLLLRALELLQGEALDVDLYVLGSDQEETGGFGASAAAFRVRPDCAVAVDVTFGVQPDCGKGEAHPLGGGPAIGVGPNMARWMTARMRETARRENIPHTVEVMSGNTGTNGWEIQVAREGVATQVLSIPQRYMHTPIEVIDLEDVEQGARLLAAFLRNLGKEALGC